MGIMNQVNQPLFAPVQPIAPLPMSQSMFLQPAPVELPTAPQQQQQQQQGEQSDIMKMIAKMLMGGG